MTDKAYQLAIDAGVEAKNAVIEELLYFLVLEAEDSIAKIINLEAKGKKDLPPGRYNRSEIVSNLKDGRAILTMFGRLAEIQRMAIKFNITLGIEYKGVRF